MKKFLEKIVFSVVVVIATAVGVYAQVPQGFNFQAVARGANGEILAEQNLGVQVSVIKGTKTGNPVYTETHSVTTNPLGLIQLIIGEGTPTDGETFTGVDFGNDNYFVKLAIDVSGGTDYEELGTTRLLSVPYALVSKKAIEGGGGTTTYNLNTANTDSSFQVNISGTTSGTAVIGFSNTGGVNSGVEGKALSGAGNSSLQVGTYGEAQGEGSGQHLGLYGYSKSNGKYNFGVYGSAKGAGDGTEIAIGNETETDGNGSFNIAGGFYSSGNINGNLGAEGVASGNIGSRVNIGVEGGAKTSANSRNLGVSAYAENSQLENVAFFGRAQSNSARNIGIRVIVNNGLNGANVGIESVADTAAILNGFTEINGNLKINGTITETSDRNLKENIKPIKNGLNTIMKLNPSSYNFRGNGEYKGLKLAQGMHFGLIAQEVEMVLPSLVQNNKHTYLAPIEGVGPNNPDEKTEVKNMEYKTMNYTELIPVLIKAMQEQQKEIEELKAQLKDLKHN